MIKTLLPLLLVAALVSPARASLEDDFRRAATPAALEPFALDIGGVLGAASVETGRRQGFPGFEVGVAGAAQFKPEDDDAILRASGADAFGVPLAYGAVGLPLGFDVAAHGMKANGLSIVGAGVRWGLFEAPVVGKAGPTAGLGVWYDRVDHKLFDAYHYGFNASAGWALPIITPFVNAGFDLTQVKVRGGDFPGITGQEAWAQGFRYGFGLDLTPFPFLRIRGAYQMLHGQPGASGALLVKF